jgi:ParB family chromosome partitioning protein
MSEEKFKNLPLSSIIWESPIRDFKEEDIERMANSIKMHGIIEPIVVNEANEKGFYEGICGRLRYEAVKKLGFQTILCRIHKFSNETEKKIWQLVENLHRKELTAIERAEAYHKLFEFYEKEMKLPREEITKRIASNIEEFTGEKESEKTIQEYLRISKFLPEKAKMRLTGNPQIGVRHALELLRLKDNSKKLNEVVEELTSKPMTVGRLKEIIDESLGIAKPPLICEFYDYVLELAEVIRKKNIERKKCEKCPIRNICNEYKKAIFELANEIKNV